MPETVLNIAATCVGTRALGPGYRSAVWVQGCKLHCPGCISPEWIPQVPNQLFSVDALAEYLVHDPKIDGITISGGEPMMQAGGLAELLVRIRDQTEVNVICFSGYRYESLLTNPPSDKVNDFLRQIDLLIDGPYIQSMNENIGLRGSSNQRFIHLTEKLTGVEFATSPRRIEYRVREGELMMVGVPPKHISEKVDQTIQTAVKEGFYVRT